MKQINPIAKLGCNLMGIILSFLIFDIKGLSILLLVSLIVGFLEGNITLRNIKKLIPLLLFGIGIFMTSFMWGSGDFSHSFSYSNFQTGLKLFLRIAIIGGLAMGFLFNINPNEMLLSLMQNLKLNSGIAYGVMVAFRFFPMMEEDMKNIKRARNIRMLGNNEGFMEKLRTPVPLLSVNIRRAEKVAIAMEARGFDRFSKRTAYKTIPWKFSDTLYLIFIGFVFTGIFFIGQVGLWSGY